MTFEVGQREGCVNRGDQKGTRCAKTATPLPCPPLTPNPFHLSVPAAPAAHTLSPALQAGAAAAGHHR